MRSSSTAPHCELESAAATESPRRHRDPAVGITVGGRGCGPLVRGVQLRRGVGSRFRLGTGRLPARTSDRRRRDGRRVPRDGPDAEAAGCVEDRRASARRRRPLSRAVLAGGAAGGEPRSSGNRPGVPCRRERWPAVPGDAVRRGWQPRRAADPGSGAAAGRGGRTAGTDRRCPRRRPSARTRAPRREAREHPARGRPRVPRGLRPGAARVDRRQSGRRAGRAQRDRRVPGARADRGRPRHREDRPVRARVRAVRVPRRAGAVRTLG